MSRLVVVLLLTIGLTGCGSGNDDAAVDDSASTTSTTEEAPPIEVRRVEGRATLSDSEGKAREYTFTFDADTSYVIASEAQEAYAYDAQTGTFQGSGEGTESPDAVAKGLALGAPDYSGREAAYFFRRDLGWLVAARARSDDPAVGTTSALTRLAWTYEGKYEANQLAGPGAPDRITAVIDQLTSFPLEVVDYAGAKVFQRLDVTELLIDESTDRERFTIIDAPTEVTDDGWLRVEEADVELRPELVPDGYAFDAAARSDEPGQTGPEASNPAEGPATAMRWTRGLDELVFTIRPSGARLDHWSNPFGGEGMFLDGTKHELKGGTFDGAEAEVVLDPQSIPHLWAIGDGAVITVAGNLTAEELIAVAQSLQGPIPTAPRGGVSAE